MKCGNPYALQIIKSPPASYFIKKAAGISIGSQEPGHKKSGTISLKHVYEIAKASLFFAHGHHNEPYVLRLPHNQLRYWGRVKISVSPCR